MVEVMRNNAGGIHIHEWADGDPRRLVVLLHGYTEHGGRYDDLGRYLAARGALVIAPDHAGHGLSAGDRGVMADFDAVVDGVHAVIDARRGDLPVVMVGHSMGGLLALRYAQRYQGCLSGMVLSAPAVGLAPFLESVLAAPTIPEQGFDGALLSRDPAVGLANAADPLVYHGPWRRETLAGALAANLAVEQGPRLDGLPLLYLHGTDDRIIPLDGARPVVTAVAGADFCVHLLDNFRHEIFNEINKTDVYALVAEFAARVAAA